MIWFILTTHGVNHIIAGVMSYALDNSPGSTLIMCYLLMPAMHHDCNTKKHAREGSHKNSYGLFNLLKLNLYLSAK